LIGLAELLGGTKTSTRQISMEKNNSEKERGEERGSVATA